MNMRLQNLYINKQNYARTYNYYNYFKFKLTGIIPIHYKSPSIFLDGLYFKVSDCQILKVSKIPYEADFILTIHIKRDDFIEFSNIKYSKTDTDTNTFIKILEDIEEYNYNFFDKNYKFFPLLRRRTYKTQQYIDEDNYNKEKQLMKDTIKLDWDGTPINIDNSKYNSSNTEYNSNNYNNPELYARYSPFIKDINNAGITMDVVIKNNYFTKLLGYFKMNTNPDITTDIIDNILHFCNQEYYILKSQGFNKDLAKYDLRLQLCLKSSMFYLDDKKIKMKWNICDFN
jgi:hypothetical protein